MPLVLRAVLAQEEVEFLRAHHATTPTSPTFLHYYEEGMPLARYLEVLAERERGEHLPDGHVPSTSLFAFAEARIVGRVVIRHSLTPVLERLGGHRLRGGAGVPAAGVRDGDAAAGAGVLPRHARPAPCPGHL